MRSKVESYLGFAKKSGNLMSGSNTCIFGMAKGKVKLVILADDISENSEKKMMKEIRKHGVAYVRYGSSDELSHATGANGRNVFAICDRNFAEEILRLRFGGRNYWYCAVNIPRLRFSPREFRTVRISFCTKPGVRPSRQPFRGREY